MSLQSLKVLPGGRLSGCVRVPGDKSISHRALMFAAIADGDSLINGFLPAEDTLATAAALRTMAVPIEQPSATQMLVHGVGRRGLQAPPVPLDMGNSGTAMRLFAGLLAGQGFDVKLVGDASLSRRPMQRVVEPLTAMGAHIECTSGGTPPLMIHAVDSLHGIDYRLPVASAQVQSAVLLAGIYASGETSVEEPAVCRDHTERALIQFGYPVKRAGRRVTVAGGGRLTGAEIDVPGDISSAAFFIVGASIAPGSDLLIEQVGVNPTRTGVIEILRLMGADITVTRRESGAEPCADIRVRYAPLHGVDIPVELVPVAIDEFPAIFVAAACASGETRLRGARELRVKESDRIGTMAEGLRRLGVRVRPAEDGIDIVGGALAGGPVRSHGDHRVAMALSMAALRANQDIIVEDCRPISTSFPDFVRLAQNTGLRVISQ
jgi:3-phosphoshikimate 1-carboxyvinyltransferase